MDALADAKGVLEHAAVVVNTNAAVGAHTVAMAHAKVVVLAHVIPHVKVLVAEVALDKITRVLPGSIMAYGYKTSH